MNKLGTILPGCIAFHPHIYNFMTNDNDYNNEMSSHLSSWIYSSNNLMIIYINFSMTSKQSDTEAPFQLQMWLVSQYHANI